MDTTQTFKIIYVYNPAAKIRVRRFQAEYSDGITCGHFHSRHCGAVKCGETTKSSKGA